jgi:hypothetical protein
MKTIFRWQKLSLILLLPLVSSFLVFPLACTKTYSVAPLSAQAVPTPTLTPCGYPGNTCTQTFTVTSTFTRTLSPTPTITLTRTFSPTPTITFTRTITNTPSHTNTRTETGTPTNTFTITATPTPSPLPTPRGFYGVTDPTTGYVGLVWLKDSIPEITSYQIYMSADGVSYTLYFTVPKSTFATSICALTDSPAGTTYDRYYFIASSNGGISPDSAPSRVVHAVSGGATTNVLTLNAFAGSPVYFTLSAGTVPGGVKRVWLVNDMTLYNYWIWGEEAVSLTNLNYGNTTPTGITYYAHETLSSGVTYAVQTLTLNNENWSIDRSYRGFMLP